MKILFSTVRVKLEQDGITRRSDVSVNSLSLADDAELLSLLSSTGAAGLWDPRTDALIPELERSTVRSISTWDATAEADLAVMIRAQILLVTHWRQQKAPCHSHGGMLQEAHREPP